MQSQTDGLFLNLRGPRVGVCGSSSTWASTPHVRTDGKVYAQVGTLCGEDATLSLADGGTKFSGINMLPPERKKEREGAYTKYLVEATGYCESTVMSWVVGVCLANATPDDSSGGNQAQTDVWPIWSSEAQSLNCSKEVWIPDPYEASLTPSATDSALVFVLGLHGISSVTSADVRYAMSVQRCVGYPPVFDRRISR